MKQFNQSRTSDNCEKCEQHCPRRRCLDGFLREPL